jgi:hypothetical protein
MPGADGDEAMKILKSEHFHYALYSLIIFVAVLRHGDAPIESAGSKLTIVLMALLIFGEAAARIVREHRGRRPAGRGVNA